MFSFISDFVVIRTYGMGYLLTAVIYLLSCVLLFRDWKTLPQCLGKMMRDWTLLLGAWVVLCSILYMIVPSTWFGLVVQFVLLMLYGQLMGRANAAERFVQQVTFFTCFILVLRISEGIGNFTDKLGWKYKGVSMTDVVMLVFMLGVVWYLRRFRTDDMQMLPRLYPLLITAICALAVSTQLYSMIKVNPAELEDTAVRGYNLYLGASFLAIILLGYYLYYAIGREHTEKIMLLAQQRRQKLDEENMIAAQQTYEALREVRHEIKNHTAYMKTLLEAGDYPALNRYFESYQARTSELVHYVSSGNPTVDAVVINYISRTKLYDIQLKTILAVPEQLPYQEADLCSLLSNLLDNAIEAGAASDAQPKVVALSIRPQMDYYMIRVENPVDTRKITPKRRLMLKTTKENPELHGYGTKIIRRIAESYGGTAKFSIEGEKFIADVMLQNCQEGEDTDGKTAHRSV